MMIQEKSWYQMIIRVSKVYNSCINFVCVILLTAQLISILVMVVGRYIFSYVPPWTEQFALFCMVWFAMFSIALAVRTDSHVKMEVLDNLVSKRVLNYFKLFGMICSAVFGFVMVFKGIYMTELTWSNKLSALRFPVGLQYFSAVAGGFFIITNAAVYCLEMFVTFQDNNPRQSKDKEVTV